MIESSNPRPKSDLNRFSQAERLILLIHAEG
jgi:hypothetical protein